MVSVDCQLNLIEKEGPRGLLKHNSESICGDISKEE